MITMTLAHVVDRIGLLWKFWILLFFVIFFYISSIACFVSTGMVSFFISKFAVLPILFLAMFVSVLVFVFFLFIFVYEIYLSINTLILLQNFLKYNSEQKNTIRNIWIAIILILLLYVFSFFAQNIFLFCLTITLKAYVFSKHQKLKQILD